MRKIVRRAVFAGVMFCVFGASVSHAAQGGKAGKDDPLNLEYAEQQEKHFGPVEPMSEEEKAEALKGFRYDPALSEEELEKILEAEKENGSGAPVISGEGPAERNPETVSGGPEPADGSLRIELAWKDNADLDLWIENQGSRLAGPQIYAESGPGLEVYRPSEDSSSEADSLYYVAVYMQPPSEETKEQSSAAAEVRIFVPGQPVKTMGAVLDYGQEKDFWVACSLDPHTGNIREINRFSDSISSALEA